MKNHSLYHSSYESNCSVTLFLKIAKLLADPLTDNDCLLTESQAWETLLRAPATQSVVQGLADQHQPGVAWRCRNSGLIWDLQNLNLYLTKSSGHSLVAQLVKNLPTMQETWVWFLGQEDPPGEGNGYPLQFSRLEIPMGRRAWRATTHGVASVRQNLVTKPPPSGHSNAHGSLRDDALDTPS